MENSIKISVIIPAYNVEKYIEKSLKSIMNQTLKEIEVIVVNDGSKDNTASIIKKISKLDKRIILIDKENEGVSKARNIGIRKAKGEYLAFIDGDDWIEKDYFEEVYKKAKKEDYEMVMSDIFINYLRSGRQKYRLEGITEEAITGEKYLSLYYNNKIIRGICNKVVKRTVFIENNLYFLEDVPSGEDMNITIKLGYLISKIGKVNSAYYHYNQYSESVTKQKTSNKIYPFLNSFKELREFIKKIDSKKLERDTDKIYKYEITSIQNFVVKDSNWNNPNYLEAVKIFLELVQDRRLNKAIKSFKFQYRLLWKICQIYPNIMVVKILHYLFRWLEVLKEKIYMKFYL